MPRRRAAAAGVAASKREDRAELIAPGNGFAPMSTTIESAKTVKPIQTQAWIGADCEIVATTCGPETNRQFHRRHPRPP
jgi:hypothetical protein